MLTLEGKIRSLGRAFTTCMVLSKGEAGMALNMSWPSFFLLSYESRCATRGSFR
jgi:hypothetical protein